MNICCTVLGLYLLAAAAKLWHNVVAFLGLCGLPVPDPELFTKVEIGLTAVSLAGTTLWLVRLLDPPRRGSEEKARRRVLAADLAAVLAILAGLGLLVPALHAAAIGMALHSGLVVWLAIVLVARSGVRPGAFGLPTTWRPRAPRPVSVLITLTALGVFVLESCLAAVLATLPGPQGGQPPAEGWTELVDSARSAPIEELVVTAAAIMLLARAGVRPATCVLISVLMRTVPHIYLGWQALAVLPLGLALAALYLRYRRVMPLIAAHAAWNAMPFLPGWTIAALPVVTLLTIVGTLAALTLVVRGPRADDRPAGIPRLQRESTASQPSQPTP
ncbi:CPBP family intramembrane metalloprotease [Streptomyces albus]|uniref:CPBP family glutamic-type intramembrane protease n=1 Tax=Streptomyces albus TaxID=1888 RepID=UPI0013B48FC4|nr:CPBP family glutamic-type intramembrane protease [Streptomyces albus]QID34346.1 CPBP family intramembrane metalloprotease [Streptomyces albus]